jgi:hypothetical protein
VKDILGMGSEPSFITIGSGIQKSGTHRQHADRISLIQESRLKIFYEIEVSDGGGFGEFAW